MCIRDSHNINIRETFLSFFQFFDHIHGVAMSRINNDCIRTGINHPVFPLKEEVFSNNCANCARVTSALEATNTESVIPKLDSTLSEVSTDAAIPCAGIESVNIPIAISMDMVRFHV